MKFSKNQGRQFANKKRDRGSDAHKHDKISNELVMWFHSLGNVSLIRHKMLVFDRTSGRLLHITDDESARDHSDKDKYVINLPDFLGTIEGEQYIGELDGKNHGVCDCEDNESKQTRRRNGNYARASMIDKCIIVNEDLCNEFKIKYEDYFIMRVFEEAMKVRAKKRENLLIITQK